MKKKKIKEPSFIHQAWELFTERYRTRKALRLLSKQEWSVEFLTALLVRAANMAHRQLEMTITNNSTVVKVNTIDTPMSGTYRDDSIFNHLDDTLRVNQFINEVNRR